MCTVKMLINLSFLNLLVKIFFTGLELATTNCSSVFDLEYFALLPNNATLPLPPQQNEFSDIYRLSYNMYPIIGFVLTTLICVVARLVQSKLTSNNVKIAVNRLKSDESTLLKDCEFSKYIVTVCTHHNSF